MKQDIVFNNFQEIIQSPNGIKRFNDLVLELAVSGNLRLKSNQIIDLETGLPNNWSTKSFSEIASFTIGKTPPTKDSSYWADSDSIMWVSIADMRNGETISQSNKYITNLAKEEVFRREPWPTGTLLMSFKLTIGKMARLGKPAFFNEAIFAFDTGNEITNEYLFRVLPVLSQKADSKGAIKGNTLNSDSIRKMLIPIPPVDEQEMLIKIIDEIGEKCKVLEQELNTSGEFRNSARKSAIDAVSTAQTSEELHTAWERIQGNWKVIAGTPDSIDSIKTLILDLAVRGDLVTVNHPNMIENIGWSASELKLDDSKLWHLPTLREEKKHGWNRIPLAKIGSWGSGGTPTSSRKDFYQDGTIPWAVIGDLNNGILTSTEASITDKALADSSSKLVPKGAILIAMYGASIGKTAITGIECCTNQAIAHCVVDAKLVSKDYFFIVAKSLKRHLIQEGKGAAQPNISQSVLKHLIIDLPPLAEQALIVERVEALMELCDRLNISLRESELLAEQFSRSVVSAST
jgi:type I restriction enzyme S subunit